MLLDHVELILVEKQVYICAFFYKMSTEIGIFVVLHGADYIEYKALLLVGILDFTELR